MGLDCVHGEHRHVLDGAGDRAGDHELPEPETVVSGFRFELGDRSEVRVLEFGRGCGLRSHFGA